MMAPSWVPLGPEKVVRVQVLDEGGACGAQRQRPGSRVAVGVAGAGEDVAETDPGLGHGRQDGHEGADRVAPARRQCCAAGETGTGGPFSAGIMTAAER